MVAKPAPPKCRAARLETTGPRAPWAAPKHITKATTIHGAGEKDAASRLAMPRKVEAKVTVAVARCPKRSAAQPEIMIPKIESSPAVPNAAAACSGVDPDSTRKGTTWVITENVVIDVNAKSCTICQYSR